MVHSAQFGVTFESDVRKVLVLLLRVSQGLVQLHVYGVNTEINVS